MTLLDIEKINPIHDRILVIDMEFGDKKTKSGFIIIDDDAKDHGIRPRWSKVVKCGPEQKEVIAGDYVLFEHGRWSRAFEVTVDGQKKKMFMMDYPRGLMLISKTKPAELEQVGV